MMPEAVSESYSAVNGMSVMQCFLLCWKLMDVGNLERELVIKFVMTIAKPIRTSNPV